MQKIKFLFVFFIGFSTFAQRELPKDKSFYSVLIGFYNLENLFDTINDPEKNDEEFLPEGANKWTSARYLEKQGNMARVIADIGLEASPDGVAILGVSEIENKLVLENLVKQKAIANRNYQIVHYDSPDQRGVDVGLLYNPKYFKVTNSKSYTLKIDNKPDFYTRDQLLVSGLLDGEEVHFIVGHWPSRRGGEKRSEPLRIEAAKLSRHIVDSLILINPDAKVIVMGDLNDDPTNQSIKKHLNSTGNIEQVHGNKMYNPMYDLHMKGIGTLAHRDVWGIFDQTILTQAWIKNDYTSYQYYTAKIFNKPYLMQQDGNFKGYPFRTFSFGQYVGGFSDHFPVYCVFLKEK
ncbi:MAG: endonuclease/exonuclease/phosphatase family protein [Flavobacteriia bacterium]|nr:endonuclease/exonuclease/phosphatase family protein [Flavobacteriia bacterium]